MATKISPQHATHVPVTHCTFYLPQDIEHIDDQSNTCVSVLCPVNLTSKDLNSMLLPTDSSLMFDFLVDEQHLLKGSLEQLIQEHYSGIASELHLDIKCILRKQKPIFENKQIEFKASIKSIRQGVLGLFDGSLVRVDIDCLNGSNQAISAFDVIVSNLHKGAISCLVFDGDATITGSLDCDIKRIKPRSNPTQLASFKPNTVQSLCMYKRLLFSGLWNGQLYVIDLEGQQKSIKKANGIQLNPGHTAPITFIEAYDDTLVTAGWDHTIRFWNIKDESFSVLKVINSDQAVTCGHMIKQLGLIVFGFTNGTIRIYALKDNLLKLTMHRAHQGRVSSITTNNIERGGSLHFYTGGDDGVVKEWALTRSDYSINLVKDHRLDEQGPVIVDCHQGMLFIGRGSRLLIKEAD